jgi:hypothetical protein
MAGRENYMLRHKTVDQSVFNYIKYTSRQVQHVQMGFWPQARHDCNIKQYQRIQYETRTL